MPWSDLYLCGLFKHFGSHMADRFEREKIRDGKGKEAMKVVLSKQDDGWQWLRGNKIFKIHYGGGCQHK